MTGKQEDLFSGVEPEDRPAAERKWVRDSLATADRPEDLSAFDFFSGTIGSRTDDELVIRIENLAKMLIGERPLEGNRGEGVMVAELERIGKEVARRGGEVRRRAVETFAVWKHKVEEFERKRSGEKS